MGQHGGVMKVKLPPPRRDGHNLYCIAPILIRTGRANRTRAFVPVPPCPPVPSDPPVPPGATGCMSAADSGSDPRLADVLPALRGLYF